MADILAHYEAHPPKGEIVLLVEGAGEAALAEKEVIDALLLTLLETHKLKEAVAIAAEQTGLPRKDVYAKALTLKAGGNE